MLTKGNDFLDELIGLLNKLKDEVLMCDSCYRFFPASPGKEKICKICSDKNRDSSMLMLIEKILIWKIWRKVESIKDIILCWVEIFPFLKKS